MRCVAWYYNYVTQPKRGQKVSLHIADMAFGGKGIARINTTLGKFVVFVQNTIPGQRVLCKITKAKKGFAEGKLIEVLSTSPHEVPIPYQRVPGAPYATLPVDVQEQFKRNLTVGLFKHMGNVTNAEELVDEFISSPVKWHYRNKIEYSFSRDVYDPIIQNNVIQHHNKI